MTSEQKQAPRRLRVGIDVGGTNTDGVIIDPSESTPNKAIKAWHKTATTPDPSDGISTAIQTMFDSAGIDASDVASVTIGTTHFVNAVVEMDASRLAPVAVLRLCGPFSKHALPCVDWDEDLRDVVLGHYTLLKGGLEVDGHLISDIDEEEIKSQCSIIKQKGIRSIVINGVFSPIDTVERQEERAAEIVKREIPNCDVVCSKEVANLGFLERENASILNAAILPFARKTISSFQKPMKTVGLNCPVFIAQNDGTVLPGAMAARLPIRTFSSGPTNSMRGAAYLVQQTLDEDIMVVDIGGTTTDVGLLQANGFPRQQAAYSDLAGVRMNFSCPDIKSIGLGGGSIIHTGEPMAIGPESTGNKLTSEAVVFGGQTLTATDFSVMSNPDLEIGNRELLQGIVTSELLSNFQGLVKKRLERIIDVMKTSPGDIPVLLVGGGAVIAPHELSGASKVVKPQWSGVANAIGAAMARLSAVEDIIVSTENQTTAEARDSVTRRAIEKTVSAGAEPATVEVVEVETLPLSYVENKTRFIIRAAGDFDTSRTQNVEDSVGGQVEAENSHDETIPERVLPKPNQRKGPHKQVDVNEYVPDVRNRTWYISETDVEWIATGCYILGTGGGGSPYSSKIRLRTELRKGAVIRVVDTRDIPDDAQVGCGGGAGSPTVAIEKLGGDEMLESQHELYKICDRPATHMISVEIGGANGLQSMIIGASTLMNLPAVDGDWMGRAYPTKWQTTPVVFNERTPIWAPIAMSDGNGNVVVMPKTSSDAHVERILRAAIGQMGSNVGAADAPVTGAETKRWVVEHTISQSWRIGRGVAKARQENQVSNVAEAIIDQCGGPSAGRVLWKGKIVGVERNLKTGHVYGECLIQGTDVSGKEDVVDSAFRGILKIPFKNENIAAIKVPEDGRKEKQEDILAIVPDLITVIDAQSGEAVGTPEYRYGLLVVVLGLAASDKWTNTERGIKLGGPESFGFNHLRYTPLGTYQPPRSVIDEYDGRASGVARSSR
ncbi:hypothetical protein V2G26_017580 [Clonostachys chloroleuca]